MQHAIRVLRTKGIGAHCATDPRGLDSVVEAAITERKRGREEIEEVKPTTRKLRKKLTMNDDVDYGFEWHRVIRKQLVSAGDDGMRRKLLRKRVLRRFLRHLGKQQLKADTDLPWLQAKPTELQALFRKRLLQAKRDGRLHTQGRMVTVT